MPAPIRRQFGVAKQARRFDTVLLGRRTHQLALDAGLTSAYPHLRQHVFTRRNDLPPDRSVRRHHDDPAEVVAQLKRQRGRDIWLCGGGLLAAQLYPQIDEMILKVNPVVLGDGVPLVNGLDRPMHFHLLSTRWLDNGVVLVHYQRVHR